MSFAPGMFEVNKKLEELEKRLEELGQPKVGQLRYNPVTNHLEFFDGAKWVSIGPKIV